MNVEEYLKETRTEATAQRTILIMVVMIVIPVLAYVYVIYLLMKGLLFGKGKLVRIFSALGLVSIAVGTIVVVRYILKDYYASETYQHQNLNEQPSVHESGERNSEDIETHPVSTANPIPPTNPEVSIPIPVIKNSDGVYDWQSMCQKEWPKSFLEIQKAFSVFGGFQLAQSPIDGFKLDGYKPLMKQEGIPLLKKYRYFQKADLTFFHGALIKFTLKVDFPKKYSMASVEREYKALQNDINENLKCLNKPDIEIDLKVDRHWVVVYGQQPRPGVHNIVGQIDVTADLGQDDHGYHLELSIDTFAEYSSNGLRKFIESVIKKEAYEAGEDLEGFDKNQQSSDDSTKVPPSRNRVPKSTDRKDEEAETRSVRTETPVPSLTIPVPEGKETSPNLPEESTDPQPQTVTQPNPHFEAAQKHNWQRLCQKEWSKSFLEIQEAFSVFGGFKLVQPPIDGIAFDTEDIQKDVPLQKQYRYFQKADLEFVNGALVGFTLKAHFAKTYSKASIDREYKAFQDDLVKNLKRLHKPELGVSVGTMPPWTVRYGDFRSPSTHRITGEIYTTEYLRQSEDGYDLTLSVEAKRGLGHFIELVVKKEADETGDELEDFDKKQRGKVGDLPKGDTSQASAVRTSKPVRITGFGSYKFGQKYSAARMTAEMWQEGGLAIKPVQVRFRKFRTLELGYAIDGKQLCRMRFCAEYPSNTDDKQLRTELANVKIELERQFGFEMIERGNDVSYEDDNYVVRLWYQSTTKTTYNTRHVGFRKQRTASTTNIKALYLLIEDKRLMPK